jgi:transcriptional regulator with XRE-family HTH domain
MEFVDWLRTEMEIRGIGVRELARLGHVSPAGISKVLSQTRQPGIEVCQGIAKAFKIPQIEVFEKAGLLNDQFSKRFANLTLEQREAILTEMEAMLEENQRSAARKALQPTTT